MSLSIIQDNEKLRKLCEDFIQEQEISSPETIVQSDRVILNSYEFIEKICDLVGYYEYDEEDEECE